MPIVQAPARPTSVSGVTFSGTPSVGFVPTATSATAATWQAVAGASLVGPYTINFNTAGFLNAADNGLLLCAVAAGSLVRVVGCVTTQFTGTMVNPEIDVVLATAVDSVASFLAIYDATDNPSGAALGAYREMPPLPARLASPLYGFANVACNVYVGLYPVSGSPTAGTVKFYVLTQPATAP